MKELIVLNLGAGVQSTTLYLMSLHGEVKFDCAIFADVGEEPEEVYRHLEWLKTLGGPTIHTVSKGKLGNDLIRGTNSDGQAKSTGRYASIPAYTSTVEGSHQGIVRRQCTSEYKIKPIERFIRRTLLGMPPGARVPKDKHVTQLFGISLDECARAARIKENAFGEKWKTIAFPLIDKMMTRRDCLKWMEARGYPAPPRSACVFCPYKTDREWLRLREGDPQGWDRAIEIDRAIRDEKSVCQRGMNQRLYLHSSCRPLEEVHLSDEDRGQLGFWQECEGMCGL